MGDSPASGKLWMIVVGTIGDSVFQAIKSFRYSPVGVNDLHRLHRRLTVTKTRAPQLEGSFAVWGRVFHDQLQYGLSQREGGPLELHHKWSLNRNHPDKKWTSGHGLQSSYHCHLLETIGSIRRPL